MTKKHFALIAASLRSSYTNGCYRDDRAYDMACRDMCSRLEAVNPRFDTTTFLSACGLF